ncbi:hypothetical protein L7F22_046133 [Adiantum nelumboides]|nr:hypothetical protein [Adiantum nelumboides]
MSFPTFNKATGEDAQEFLDNLEIACLVTGHDDDATRLQVFPLLMKADAKAWFNTLLSANRGDWAGLRVLFLAKFDGGGETSESLWDKMCELRQGSLFEYNVYEFQFVELWERWVASLRLGEAAPGFLKKDCFVAGLCPPLREKVKAEEEEQGKSLPKDKGKAKVEDVDAMPIKRAIQGDVAMSETGERRKSKENGESSSKEKSKPRRKLTIKKTLHLLTSAKKRSAQQASEVVESKQVTRAQKNDDPSWESPKKKDRIATNNVAPSTKKEEGKTMIVGKKEVGTTQSNVLAPLKEHVPIANYSSEEDDAKEDARDADHNLFTITKKSMLKWDLLKDTMHHFEGRNLRSLKGKDVVTEETHNEEEEEDCEQRYSRHSNSECPSKFEEDEDKSDMPPSPTVKPTRDLPKQGRNLHSLKEKDVKTEETHNEGDEEDREQQYPRRSDGECPSEFKEDEDKSDVPSSPIAKPTRTPQPT